MDPRVVDMLRRLNSDFYRRCAPSFSSTRQAPWEGWRACLPYLREAARDGCGVRGGDGSAPGCDDGAVSGCDAKDVHGGRELSLLDVACGNGRFEAFLAQELRDTDARATAVDDCAALLNAAAVMPGVTFVRRDALAALIANEPWVPDLPPVDASVSFGFLHHIPSAALRERALRALLNAVRPGGIAIVSLWCFLEDERLSRKAERSHAEALAALAPGIRESLGLDLAAQLEPGDRFLGWQDAPGLWRYCHSFDDGEIDRLAAAVADGAHEVARFRSDGKTGRLNAYLIFRKQ